MSDRVLREFHVDGINYYDGKRNILGSCECVLTDESLIINDMWGGTRQILLRDIKAIRPRLGLIKSLDLQMGYAAISIYEEKDRILEISDMLNAAISSRLTPPQTRGDQSNRYTQTTTSGSNQTGNGRARQVPGKGFVTTPTSFGILGGGIISLLLSYLTAIEFLLALGFVLVLIWVTIQIIAVFGGPGF